MGVPKFFRWLSERYPALLTRVNAYDIPDVDNFYLDMNGIIHSCSHPDDDDANAFISDGKIFEDVFAYIDTLVRIIRPRRLLFLAIDGVAPRAKMNQQRSRRFRTARMAEQQEMESRQRGEWKESVTGADDEKRFDSNTITPGTDFMCRLDEHLQYYIQRQMNEDPLWRQLKVIYSSHLTPGEGEHKIMDYIRYARSKSNYDVRTRHCLYGLDADLIMLGMASHEPYFTLLREEVKFGAPSRGKSKDTKDKAPMKNKAEQITFFLLHLSLLRGYLEAEFQDLKDVLAERFSIESIVDDWVFMNMLVGNDFIPHLPFMHINKGSLQKFYDAYRRAIPEMGGYINDHGELHVDRFMIFIRHIAQAEQELMSEAREDDEWLMSKKRRGPIDSDDIWDDVADEENGGMADAEFMFGDENNDQPVAAGSAAMRSVLKRPAKLTAEELRQAEQREFDTFASDMRYNYYKKKFCLLEPSDDDVKSIAHELVRALVWNLGYYYCGVQSWDWYYPYHYSPYASDIWRVCSAEQFRDVDFLSRGRPFLPFEQLMAVLPARSKPCLPPKLQGLFSTDSPIYDFYPTDFLQDMDDKQNDWEAVVCVPFVDEERLVRAVADVLPQLSDEERRRNTVQPSYIYTYVSRNEISRTLMSPNVRKLPNIGSCSVRERYLSYEQMLLPKDRIKYGVLVDTGSLQKYRKGYPQLSFVRFTAKVCGVGVKVFTHSSKSMSVLLKVESAACAFGLQVENNNSVEAENADGFDFLNNNSRSKKNIAGAGGGGGGPAEISQERIDAEIDIGCEHLGGDILVDWPYLYEARVERVIDGLNGEQHVFDANDGMIKQIAYTETPEMFTRQMGAFGVQLKEKLAIDVGRTCVALGIRRKIGYQLYYDNNGRAAQLQPQYEKEMRTIPMQLCVPINLWKLTTAEDNPINASGFTLANKTGAIASSEGQMIDVKSIFKRDDVIFCTAAPFYGAMGRVVNVVEQQPSAQQRPGAWGQRIMGGGSPRLMVQAKFLWPYEPDMLFVRQNYQDNIQPSYWGARELSQYLRMHPKLVSAFTGTLYVVHSKLPGANVKQQQQMLLKKSMNNGENIDAENDADETDELDPLTIAGMRSSSQYNNADTSLKNVAKSNIGLNLKKNKSCKEVRGYSLKDLRTSQWLYSDRVAEVMSRWRDKYPAAVEALSENMGSDIRVDLLFADELDPMESLREMRKFINDLVPDAQRIEQSSGCDYIDDAGIAELRRSRAATGPLDMHSFVEAFRPQHLYRFMPGINDNAPPDSRPVYRIWDRVINVRSNCAVPVGIRGTVVRVEYEEAETNGGETLSFDRRSNNNQSFQDHQQQPRNNERRQRLIQVLWDESFKVNGQETDLHDLPPWYLMNISYGRKLKELSGAYDHVRTQSTQLTPHDFAANAGTRKHKLPDDDDAEEEMKHAVRRHDQPSRDVVVVVGKDVPAASDVTINLQQPTNSPSDLDVLNRFLRKSSGNVDATSGSKSDSNVSPTIKSEALLELEAMITASSNNNVRTNEFDDAVKAGKTSAAVDLLSISDDELNNDFEPPAEFPATSGKPTDGVILCESSELHVKNFLALLQKKTAECAVQQQQQQRAAVGGSPSSPSDGNGTTTDPAILNAKDSTTSFGAQFLKPERMPKNFTTSPSKKNNSRSDSSSKKVKKGNENGEEWVNSFRDDYFEGDQEKWHAPPVLVGEEDEASNNKNYSGATRGGRSRGSGGGGLPSFRGRGDSVRGSRGGRGVATADADDIYARAQRAARFNAGEKRGREFGGGRQRMNDARTSSNNVASTREIIIDADSMNINVKVDGFDANEGEWNEEWSQPFTSTFVASRGPRSSRGIGGRAGFSPRGGFSARGGGRNEFGAQSRQQRGPPQQSFSRNYQRVDEDADDDDEEFGTGQWQEIVQSRGRDPRQNRPYDNNNNSRRPFAQQRNSYAVDSDAVGYNSQSITFHRKQQFPSSPNAAERNSSSRYSDANRDRFVQQRTSVQQQSRPSDGGIRRGGRGADSVPMPSNAAECVVYSVDDDYVYADNGDFANHLPPPPHRQQHEAVYAPAEPLDDFTTTTIASPSSPVKQSQPSATSISSAGSSGKAVLSTLIQQLNNKKGQQPTASNDDAKKHENAADATMSEALQQLEKLALDLPPPDEDEFPAETDEDADANKPYAALQNQQRPVSSSDDVNNNSSNVAKMFSLAQHFGGINFVSGGFLQPKTNDSIPETLPQAAAPFPFGLPPSSLPFPPVRPEWRAPPSSTAHAGGVDPAVHSAGAGALHYRQPVASAEQMHAYMHNVHQQQLYEAQARQYYAWMQQQQQQQQQQQYFMPPRTVVIPQMPPNAGAYAQRPFMYMQPPPPQAARFAVARAQAFAAGSGGNSNNLSFMPPPTLNFPAQHQQQQQQPRRAASSVSTRPTMSMIPRSALLRNSIARRPETNVSNDDEE